MGTDTFHEDRSYRTGINNKLKYLTCLLDDPTSSVEQRPTMAYFRRNKLTTNEPLKQGSALLSTRVPEPVVGGEQWQNLVFTIVSTKENIPSITTGRHPSQYLIPTSPTQPSHRSKRNVYNDGKGESFEEGSEEESGRGSTPEALNLNKLISKASKRGDWRD